MAGGEGSDVKMMPAVAKVMGDNEREENISSNQRCSERRWCRRFVQVRSVWMSGPHETHGPTRSSRSGLLRSVTLSSRLRNCCETFACFYFW